MKNDNRHDIDGWDAKNVPIAMVCAVVGIVAIIAVVVIIAGAISPSTGNQGPNAHQTSQVPQTNTSQAPGVDASQDPSPAPYVLKIPGKYSAAYDTNDDLVGWVSISNTRINFPTVQTADNEKYLRTDFDGTPKEYGDAIFVDYRVDLSKGQNPILYGHNLLSGDGFAQLCRYWPWFENYNGTVAFAERNPIIRYEDFYENGRPEYLVFATAYVTADTTDPYYLNIADYIDIESKAEFKSKMTEVLDRSAFYNYSMDIAYGDRILILSTCLEMLGKAEDTRLLVFARQARDDEDLADYDPKFEINDEPLYFEGYYNIMSGAWDPDKKKPWPADMVKN